LSYDLLSSLHFVYSFAPSSLTDMLKAKDERMDEEQMEGPRESI
jgi:hypothetical protein